MAGSAVIGALRVNLGIDTAAFTRGLAGARKQLKSVGREMQSVGRTLAVGVTAPIAGIGTAALRASADFEKSMNSVKALTGATGAEFTALRDKARELGRTTRFSASEAAAGIEMLVKNNVSAQNILGGVLDATLQLSAATGTDLPTAADIATDAMASFGKQAGDMKDVINGIAGVTLNSKFGMDDYRLAIAQGGGKAGDAGVEFEEFNAVLAATAYQFGSGSDAGTSFKNFLTFLNPKSSAAEAAIKDLGLSFYDANGNLRSMAEIAQNLQDKLGGLSEQARSEALHEIFGSDAMRTAIGLMNAGADGIERLQEAIAEVDAQKQAETRLQGFWGEVKKLQSALEGLAIAIGDSGLLQFMTDLVAAVREWVAGLENTSPELLKWGTIVAGLAAAIGPIVFAIGAMALALSAISAPVLAGVAAFAALSGVLLAFGDRIVPAVQSAWTTLRDAFGPRLEQLAAPAQTAFRQIGDALAEVFGVEAGEMLDTAFAKLREIVAAMADFGVDQWIATVEAAILSVTALIETISGVVQSIIHLLRGDFTAAWNELTETIANLKARWLEIFNTLFREVIALVPQFIEDFIAAFAALKERMVQIGRDIMQGLIDGIRSMAGAVKDAAIETASGVRDWFARQLGIHSPSTVMHELGVNTMEGYRNGLVAMRESVVGVARDTASQVSQAIQLVQGNGDPWAGLKQSTQEASSTLQDFGNVGQSIGSTISSAFKGVIDGSKSVKDALLEVLGKLAELFINQGFQAITQGLFGGKGGLGGGLFSGLFSGLKGLFGFADGGSMSFGGGNNSMDNQLAMFRVSAGENVKVSRGEDDDAGGGVAALRVFVDEDGRWQARVAKIAEAEASRATKAGISSYDRNLQGASLLDRMNAAKVRFG